MPLPRINPAQTSSWKDLQEHYEQLKSKHLKDLFASDPDRAARFSIRWNGFLVDYSKNRIDAKTLNLLESLARECGLEEAMECYFKGEAINETEDRAVLHTALRSEAHDSLLLDGENIVKEVYEVR